MTDKHKPVDPDDETREYGADESHVSLPTTDGQPAALPHSIGPFKITGVLGEGGMGVVYEAVQQQPKRRVALKVIRSGSFASEHQVRMFEREADMLGRLKHSGIAEIYHFDKTDDGRPYFVMELIQGKPLDEYLAEQPPLTSQTGLRTRLALFRQICDAVHYAHQRGVIHRDLKPSNVLVVEADSDESTSRKEIKVSQAKILDFGLARITDVEATRVTEVGIIKGTLQYMSPEQTSGRPEDVDTRADVYALGALLYEMLSGKRPYDLKREAIAEAIRIICEKNPEPLGSTWSAVFRPDPDIETIVAKALEKQPDRRYSSVAAFADDIERYLTSQPILARPPSAAYQLRKMITRHRLPFAIGVAALLLIVAASVVSTSLYIRAKRAAERERIETAKAEEVAEFMTDMLKSVAPSVALGRDTTMLREILDSTVERIELELGNSPEVAQNLQSYIAQTYFDLSELEAARKLYRSALARAQEVYGPEHSQTLEEMNSLAIVLAATDDQEEAEQLFRETLEIRRRLLPQDDPLIGTTLMYLGNLMNDLARYDKSEEHLVEANRIFRASESDGSETLGIALNSLANLYHGLGRLDEAEALYREALAMHTELNGPDHPYTLVDRHNLAFLFRSRGDLEAAATQFEEILEEQRRILGADHRNLATTMTSIAGLLEQMDDLPGAIERYRESLALIGRIQGEDTTAYAYVLDQLAGATKDHGELEQAEALYRQAIAINVAAVGVDSEQAAGTRLNLGVLLMGAGRFQEAREQLSEALRIRSAQKSPTGLLALTHYRLGELLFKIGGDDNVARGEQLWREAIQIYTDFNGPEHSTVPNQQFRLGRQLAKRGAYAEAEMLMLQAHAGFEIAYGVDHRYPGLAAKEIVQLYEDWGKPDKAAEWQAQAAE